MKKVGFIGKRPKLTITEGIPEALTPEERAKRRAEKRAAAPTYAEVQAAKEAAEKELKQ